MRPSSSSSENNVWSASETKTNSVCAWMKNNTQKVPVRSVVDVV